MDHFESGGFLYLYDTPEEREVAELFARATLRIPKSAYDVVRDPRNGLLRVVGRVTGQWWYLEPTMSDKLILAQGLSFMSRERHIARKREERERKYG